MKHIFAKLSVLVLIVAAFFALSVPQLSAQTKTDICAGVAMTGGSCAGGDTEVNNLVATIVNTFSIVVGVVAVIMIIFGGFKYITSGGDSGGISSAKNTILFAIVGLIIVAMAQAIVRFVLNKVT